jgi:hypothetical protein
LDLPFELKNSDAKKYITTKKIKIEKTQEITWNTRDALQNIVVSDDGHELMVPPTAIAPNPTCDPVLPFAILLIIMFFKMCLFLILLLLPTAL